MRKISAGGCARRAYRPTVHPPCGNCAEAVGGWSRNICCTQPISSCTPEALSKDEEVNILWLAGDGPLPVSRAVRREDGDLDFTSGPLKRLAELEALRSVFRRERRATAVLPLHGKEHKINLSFEIEQETGSSNGAGSPPEAKAADIL